MAKRASSSAEKPAPVQHRFTELIPPKLDFDFVAWRFRMLLFSWGLIAIGLVSVFFGRGLNLGIDFAGGTMVHVKFAKPADVTAVRDSLASPDLHDVVVQDADKIGREYLIRAPHGEGNTAAVTDAIKGGLQKAFGEGTFDVLRVESVGPKVGSELVRDAILAVVFATIVMGLYIAFRFELRFGLGAAIALVHDVLMTIGALSLGGFEFDLTTVAALLTVVGYSVHDTVIVSDRIRENMKKMRREDFAHIINLSINETLSRTLITSGTAIIVCLALFLLGGSVIHTFAFSLLVGFIVGTYSSIFVAAPVVLYFERRSAAKR